MSDQPKAVVTVEHKQLTGRVVENAVCNRWDQAAQLIADSDARAVKLCAERDALRAEVTRLTKLLNGK